MLFYVIHINLVHSLERTSVRIARASSDRLLLALERRDHLVRNGRKASSGEAAPASSIGVTLE